MGPDKSAAIAAHWSVANWSSWSLRSLIFLIPAFLDLLNPCIHGSSWSLRSWIFLIPVFMDVPDHCVHGSSWSLHSWVFLIPAFMGLLDPCVHGSSWSLSSWVFLIPAFMGLLDHCIHGSSWSLRSAFAALQCAANAAFDIRLMNFWGVPGLENCSGWSHDPDPVFLFVQTGSPDKNAGLWLAKRS